MSITQWKIVTLSLLILLIAGLVIAPEHYFERVWLGWAALGACAWQWYKAAEAEAKRKDDAAWRKAGFP